MGYAITDNRRLRVVVLAIGLLAMLGTTLAAPAMSEGLPDHPHMLVIGLEWDAEEDEPIGWRRCVDLANGRNVPLHAHHDNLHIGRAGEAQWEAAGNAVVPGAPLTPWANCQQLHDFFFGTN